MQKWGGNVTWFSARPPLPPRGLTWCFAYPPSPRRATWFVYDPLQVIHLQPKMLLTPFGVHEPAEGLTIQIV